MAKRIRRVYKRTSNWRARKKRSKARTKANWEKLEGVKAVVKAKKVKK